MMWVAPSRRFALSCGPCRTPCYPHTAAHLPALLPWRRGRTRLLDEEHEGPHRDGAEQEQDHQREGEIYGTHERLTTRRDDAAHPPDTQDQAPSAQHQFLQRP